MDPQAPTPIAPPKPRRRWLLRFLLLLLLGPLLSLGLLIGTEAGLDWGLRQAERLLEGRLRIARVEGRLLDRWRLEGLRFRDGEMDLAWQALEFSWQPAELLQGRLHINAIDLAGLRYRLPPSPATPPPVQSPLTLPEAVPIPLELRLDRLTLSDARLLQPDGSELPLPALRLQAVAEPRRIRIEPLELEAPAYQLRLSGGVTPRTPYPLELQLTWQAQLPDLAPFSGELRLGGDLSALRLEQRLTAPFAAQLQASLEQPLTEQRWQAKLEFSDLELQRLRPDLPAIPLHGDLTAQGQGPAAELLGRIQGDPSALIPGLGEVALTLRAGHRDGRIRFDEIGLQRLTGGGRISLRGALRLPADEPLGFAVEGDWQGLGWPLQGEPEYRSERGAFRLDGAPEAYRVQLQAGAALPEAGEVQVLLAGDGGTERFTIDTLELRPRQGDFKLTGKVAWAPAPSWVLQGEWQGIGWPLQGEPEYRSERGAFHSAGDLEAYDITLDTGLSGRDLPPLRLQTQGQGNSQGIRLQPLRIELLNGALGVSGELAWQPELRWHLELSADGIEPGVQWPEAAGRLDLRARSEGRLAPEGIHARLGLERLGGTFRGLPVEMVANIGLEGEQLQVERFAAEIGKAKLQAAGELASQWDMEWSLDTPDLAPLWPGLAGRIQGKGRLGGPRGRPTTSTQLEAAAVRLGETGLEALRLEADLDLGDQRESRLELKAAGLSQGEQRIEGVHLTGQGRTSDHRLALKVQAAPATLTLDAAGGWDGRRWSSSLSRLDLQNPELGELRLDGPARLVAGAERAELPSACWRSGEARLCLDGQWRQGQGGQGQVKLEGFTLERLQPWLPPELDARGQVGLAAQARVDGQGMPLSADARLDLEGELAYQIDAGETLRLPLQGGRLDANLKDRQLQGKLKLAFGQLGELKGAFGLDQRPAEPVIEAQLQAKLRDLSFLPMLVPDLAEVKGELALAAQVKGPLSAPRPALTLKLQDGALQVPRTGVAIEALQLEAHNQGEMLVFSGGANSGDGHIQWNGRVRPPKPEQPWLAYLEVKGKAFEVSNTPEAWLLVNPDLTLVAQPGRVELEGSVEVPRAKRKPV